MTRYSVNYLLLFILLISCQQFVDVGCDGDDEDNDIANHTKTHNETEAIAFPPKNYDNRESGIHGGPQMVNVTVWVDSIVNIDVSAMEYVMHGYVIQEWHDARLANILEHPMILLRSDALSVWLPDIYCLSCRSSTLNSPTQTNVLVKVFPNGTVYYSQLAKLHSSCFMELHNFPFDAQTCPLNLSSFGNDMDNLIYSWKKTPVVEKMTLEQFIVNGNVVPHSEIKSFPAGNFTILSFELFFTRQIGFYVLQVYIPSAVLVSLSWMTFFMEPADIGDRLSIGVTLILTMIFLLGYINQSLPKVSYIKAVDWYVIASLFMIVSSVTESVLVYWLLHRTQKKEEKKEENSFMKFDRYLDKKMQSSMSFMPFINTGNQAGGISMPNLSAAAIPKPIHHPLRSLSELAEDIDKNGKSGYLKQAEHNKPFHPLRSLSELTEDIEKNGKSGYLNHDENKKPVIGEGLCFTAKTNSIEEQRDWNTAEESEKASLTQQKPETRQRRSSRSLNRLNHHRNSMHNLYITNKRRHGTISAPSPEAIAEQQGGDDVTLTEDNEGYYPNLDKIYKLDIFARTVFPLSYVIFSLTYFIYYTYEKRG